MQNKIKRIEWNNDKNQQLIKERQLSFEQVQLAIESGSLIDVIHHPQKKYKNQRIFVIDIDGYVVLVPFVEDDEKVFLKTAFKSRKLTKHYLRGKKRAKD